MGFVLFASEWWRREYSHGQWGWEGIFEPMGFSPRDVQVRGQIIEGGLKAWGRDVHIINGERKFLGSVILESGLPIRRMENGNSRHKTLFRQVIQAKAYNPSIDAEELVRQKSSLIPQTLQRSEIYGLIAEVCNTCVLFGTLIGFVESNDPIGWLNTNQPQWKDEFPFDLEEQGAKTLLNFLIHETRSVASRVISKIEFVRTLVPINDGYRIEGRLANLGKTMPVSQLADFIGDSSSPPQELPPRLAFFLKNSKTVQKAVDLTMRVGQKNFRVVQRKTKFIGKHAVDGFYGEFTGPSGQALNKIELIGGEALDPGKPWVFDDLGNKIEFVEQGSAVLAAEKCFVVVPNFIDLHADMICELPELACRIFCIKTDTMITINEIDYHILLGREEIEKPQILVLGRTLNIETLPRIIFLGFPKFQHVQQSGFPINIKKSQVFWRYYGRQEEWRAMENANPFGYIEVGLKLSDDGKISQKRQIGVLPASFQIIANAHNSSNSGTLEFKCELGGVKIEPKNKNIPKNVVIKTLVEQRAFSVSASDCEIPRSVEFEVQTSALSQSIIIAPNFPLPGVRLFKNDRIVKRFEAISFSHLIDLSLQIYVDPGKQTQNHIRLFAKLRSASDFESVIDLGSMDESGSIGIFQFREIFAQLFSQSELLDDVIQLEIWSNGRTDTQIFISRYNVRLERDPQAQTVLRLDNPSMKLFCLDDLKDVQLSAIRLDAIHENPHKLPPIKFQGVPVGKWELAALNHYPGPWLVYPDENLNIEFRPRLWPVDGDPTITGLPTMSKISYLMKPSERKAEYFKILDEAADNFDHEFWQYLEKVFLNLGHLPLSTHDLLPTMIKHPRIMAALAFKDLNFDLTRFEEELPFFWLSVPMSVWNEAISDFRNRHKEMRPELFEFYLNEKVDQISEFASALKMGINYLIAPSQQRTNIDIVTALLLKNENSAFQRLLKTAEDTWPRYFNQDIYFASKGIDGDFGLLIDAISPHLTGTFGYRSDVLLAPVLIGIEWVTGERTISSGDTKIARRSLHKIKQLRRFDSEWFDDAFSWTLILGVSK